MKNIIIYDDNKENCLELKNILHKQFGEANIKVDIAVSYHEVQNLLESNIYDIFFIDIELESHMNGIEFSKEFQKRHPDVNLVYITAHIRYCEEIFTTSPTAFLIKPFTDERVSRTLRIIEQKRNKDRYLVIGSGKNTVQQIRLDEISYIENISRKLTFFNSSHKAVYEFYGIKISQIEGQLPDYFIRCHHSICVNLNFAKGIARYCFILKGDKQISISQSRFREARSAYINFLGGKL